MNKFTVPSSRTALASAVARLRVGSSPCTHSVSSHPQAPNTHCIFEAYRDSTWSTARESPQCTWLTHQRNPRPQVHIEALPQWHRRATGSDKSTQALTSGTISCGSKMVYHASSGAAIDCVDIVVVVDFFGLARRRAVQGCHVKRRILWRTQCARCLPKFVTK